MLRLDEEGLPRRAQSRKAEGMVFRFDHESYVVVYCREHSDVVQMVSNLADQEVAEMYANNIRSRGGFVFQVCSAGVLIAALKLIKDKESTADHADDTDGRE